MPKIDHEARKARIITASIRLFAKYGYPAVNFAMIAKESGLARTLLYGYYKDKRSIFNAAINGVTARVEAKYAQVVHSRQSADAKLRQICITVFAMLFDNREFVCVIADQLAHLRRIGEDVSDRVVEHTVGVKKIMFALINEAIRRHEYDRRVNVQRSVDLLYSQFEAAALQLAITGKAELSECIDRLDGILFAMRDANAPRVI